MTSSTHRIRRQRWLITASNSAQAFSLRKKVQDEWGSIVDPALERAFDELAPNGEVVRIDKLEIALNLSAGALDQKPEAIQQQVFQKVREQLEPLIRSSVNRQTKSTTGNVNTDEQQFRFQQLIRYLSTGSLSWESAGLLKNEILSSYRLAITEHPGELLDYFRSKNPGNAFIFRMLQLCTDHGGLDYLIPLFHPNWGKEFLNSVQLLISSEAESSHFFDRLKVASSLLEQAINSKENHLLPDFSIPLSLTRDVMSDPLMAYLKMLPLSDIFLPGLREESRILPGGEGASGMAIRADKSDQSTEEQPGAKIPLPEEPGSQDGILVTDGGVILLHPFLEQLFLARGIVTRGEKTIPSSKLAKAASLLHYAVTGSTSVYEFELGISKILLSLDISVDLPVSEGLLDKDDSTEVESMLEAVISHWAALKNTSVNGLRESFLQRDGLISWKEEQLTLNIERKPYDMLLDMLPWTISIVKLPWMQKPIYTEW